jgi:GNAT superfamily N-acetyltransferase
LGTIYRDASLSNAGDRDVLLAHPAALEFDSAPIVLGAVRVAVDDDQVVGFATTTRTGTPREAELVDLFVAPAAMRRGIATVLIKDARDVARNLGCEFLAVTANPHASAFYAAAGFRGGEVVQTEFGVGKRLTLEV